MCDAAVEAALKEIGSRMLALEERLASVEAAAHRADQTMKEVARGVLVLLEPAPPGARLKAIVKLEHVLKFGPGLTAPDVLAKQVEKNNRG